MTVYADVIFFYNFLIDWILLWSTAYLLKIKVKWYRMALGASLGALYTLIVFVPSLFAFYTFFTKLLLSIVMILSVFGFYRLHVFLKRLLMFYLVSFVIGGGLLGINYLLQSENEVLSGIVFSHTGGFGTPVTWGFIAIGFPLLWWLSGKGVKQLKDSDRRQSLYGDVTVYIAGNLIECRGLVDTGNQLYEPITRVPVIIMELELFKEYLPGSLYKAVHEQKDLSSDLSFMEVDEQWLGRIRVIPYRSVSRGMDLLLAIRPDKIRISLPSGVYGSTRVLLGLNAISLASDGSFQAIIHPRLTEEENLLEKVHSNISKEAM